VLQWARANGCPWDESTCAFAAEGGGRVSRGASVGARERLPVGREDVRVRGGGRVSRGATLGVRERLPIGRVHVIEGGGWRAPRCAAVGARERLPVELAHAPSCERAHTGMGGGERRTRVVRRSPGARFEKSVFSRSQYINQTPALIVPPTNAPSFCHSPLCVFPFCTYVYVPLPCGFPS